MKTTYRRPAARVLQLGSIALALLALQGPTHAADYVWKGANGNWDDANQWTLLGVPGAGESAVLSAGATDLSAARAVGTLRINGGRLYGGELTVGSLTFEAGVLGGFTSGYTTGSTTVTGATTFDGTRSQSVNLNHTLTLQGASRWTAGTGAIGGSVLGGVIVSNATFADEGAGSANATKTLRSGSASGGGSFVNNGSYVRTGLGTTRAYGFSNAGTLQVNSGTMELRDSGASTGQINVASGAQLSFYESTATVSGGIANLGVVSFDRGNTHLTSTARLDGNVNILGGVVNNASTNTLNALSLQGGELSGTGHWTVATLDFQSGTLGGSAAISSYPTGATTVTGTTTFNGARSQSVNLNHTLTLQGDSRWTAGAGAIGGSVFGGVIVNNATFNDDGAGTATAYKTLRSGSASGGGSFVNNGSYVRAGLGVTYAYGFDNRGLLQIQSGTFDARDGFANTGTVDIATAAVLRTSAKNAGLITGTGTVDTGASNVALVNSGTLNPGDGGTLGTLTIAGGLRLTDSSVLHVDLGGAGLSDHLIVTNQALWDGELSVWLNPGTSLQLGDVYTVASAGQRLSNSAFDSISWHGLSANQFAVEYTADSVLLRVTAVPEPATYALWALGIVLIGARKLRGPARA